MILAIHNWQFIAISVASIASFDEETAGQSFFDRMQMLVNKRNAEKVKEQPHPLSTVWRLPAYLVLFLS